MRKFTRKKGGSKLPPYTSTSSGSSLGATLDAAHKLHKKRNAEMLLRNNALAGGKKRRKRKKGGAIAPADIAEGGVYADFFTTPNKYILHDEMLGQNFIVVNIEKEYTGPAYPIHFITLENVITHARRMVNFGNPNGQWTQRYNILPLDSPGYNNSLETYNQHAAATADAGAAAAANGGGRRKRRRKGGSVTVPQPPPPTGVATGGSSAAKNMKTGTAVGLQGNADSKFDGVAKSLPKTAKPFYGGRISRKRRKTKRKGRKKKRVTRKRRRSSKHRRRSRRRRN